MNKYFYIPALALIALASYSVASKPGNSSVVVCPIPRAKILIQPFVASGYQYWEPERGNIAASLLRSSLIECGRFAVLDSTAFGKSDTTTSISRFIGTDRYEIRGEILKLGTMNKIVVSAMEPKTGQVVRSWEESIGNLEFMDQAINRLARRIASDFPLRGMVLRVEGNEVSIELGAIDGLKVGQLLEVFRVVQEILHPVTGVPVEWRIVPLGEVKVTAVGPQISRAEIVAEKLVGSIQPGDRLKVKRYWHRGHNFMKIKMKDIDVFRDRIDLQLADKELTKRFKSPERIIWDIFQEPESFSSRLDALQFLYLAILNDPRMVAAAMLRVIISCTEPGFDPRNFIAHYFKGEYDDPEIGAYVEKFLKETFEEN